MMITSRIQPNVYTEESWLEALQLDPSIVALSAYADWLEENGKVNKAEKIRLVVSWNLTLTPECVFYISRINDEKLPKYYQNLARDIFT